MLADKSNSDTKTRLDASAPGDEEDGEKAASFEDVLEELGMPARYQLSQVVLLCLNMGIGTCLVFSYVFTGYEPPHVCNTVNETEFLSELQLQNGSEPYATLYTSYHACEIGIHTNDSGRDQKLKSVSCPSGRNYSGGRHTSMVSEWDMSCESTGLTELVALFYSLGQIVGGSVASFVADKFGRKWVFSISNVALFALETAVIFMPTILGIGVIRFVTGMFQEAMNDAGLVMVMELLIPRQRTVYGIAECVIWVGCTLLVGGLAYATQGYGWRGFQVATAALGLGFPLTIFFVHESPRWLVSNGKIPKALGVLRIASRQNKKDFAKVRAKFLAYVEAERTGKSQGDAGGNHRDPTSGKSGCQGNGDHGENGEANGKSLLSAFCQREVIVLMLITSFAWLTHDLTYYGMYMTSSTLSGDRFLNFTLMALTEIPSNLALMVLMPRMGRRKIMAAFLGLASASLVVCSLMETFSSRIPDYSTVSLTFFLLGKFAVTSSYNVIYIYTPEVFPTNIRTMGFGICSSVGKIGSLLAPYFRPFYATASWGPAVTFAVMCVVTLGLIPALPEMKDVNLRDSPQDGVGVNLRSRVRVRRTKRTVGGKGDGDGDGNRGRLLTDL